MSSVLYMQEPIEISFGELYYVDRFSGRKRQKVITSDTFYHIPLLETLKNLLTHSEVYTELKRPRQSTDLIVDFCDGSVYQQHPLFSSDPHALQIVGYFDELEICNPLGSYVSTHKLGCLFFTLGNIRPQFRSTLRAIFLVSVGRHSDIIKYGLDAFLTPFVEDLKTLYLDGVTVTIDSEQCTFHGGLLATLADNLAAHSLGGFKESHSFALRICRGCIATTESMQTTFIESGFQLRTPTSHELHCTLLEGPLRTHYSTTYGVNRRSVLEDVPGFSVITGLPHDTMHDLFEGVVPYELKCFLFHCIEARLFSFKQLNDRISRFDFNEDRPSLIQLRNEDQKIRQSASQMIVLTRELPMLVADLIPETDEHWKSFIILLKICSIALSPITTPDTVAYLRVLIEEKLTLFVTLYPDKRIIPKQHYMVHYPRQIEQFGPLVHSWCMRHEAKLSFIKRASKRGNFKNMCQTVAKKHQLWLCYQLQCEDHLIYPSVQKSLKCTVEKFCNEPEHVQEALKRVCPIAELVDEDCTVERPAWLKIHNYKFKSGVFVLLKYDEISPQFAKVVEVIVVGNSVFVLSLQLYSTECFDAHYNSFVVKPRGSFMYTNVEKLSHYRPICVRRSFNVSNRSLYVSLPCTY